MSDLLRDREFEEVLAYLKASRNLDLTGYRRSSLSRRVRQRMQEVGAAAFAQYRSYLEAHPNEFTALINLLLINVTGFFRDPQSWERLEQAVVTPFLAAMPPDRPVRVWSAGCASGAEPYTIAMLLAETLGRERYRDCVTIYATDIDEDALDRARRATYSLTEIGVVPDRLRERYFAPAQGGFAVSSDLRRGVVFGRHDLLRDAPISHVDLLICRNTLIYFESAVQQQVLTRFHRTQNDRGFLFVGRTETLFGQESRFIPIDLPHRIFARRPDPLGGGPESLAELRPSYEARETG